MAANKTNAASSVNARSVVDDLFARMEQPSESIGVVRTIFRVTGNVVRDSGSLFAEITEGRKAARVAYAVARQESELHHKAVIEARVARLLAQ